MLAEKEKAIFLVTADILGNHLFGKMNVLKSDSQQFFKASQVNFGFFTEE